MNLCDLFYGSLKLQPGIDVPPLFYQNPPKTEKEDVTKDTNLPKDKQKKDKFDKKLKDAKKNINLKGEDGGVDKKEELGQNIPIKYILKDNYVIFTLENSELLLNESYFNAINQHEMTHEKFWSYLFSNSWSGYSTIRLNGGSLYNLILLKLDTLMSLGYLECEELCNYNDYFPIRNICLKKPVEKEFLNARIEFLIYKLPSSCNRVICGAGDQGEEDSEEEKGDEVEGDEEEEEEEHAAETKLDFKNVKHQEQKRKELKNKEQRAKKGPKEDTAQTNNKNKSNKNKTTQQNKKQQQPTEPKEMDYSNSTPKPFIEFQFEHDGFNFEPVDINENIQSAEMAEEQTDKTDEKEELKLRVDDFYLHPLTFFDTNRGKFCCLDEYLFDRLKLKRCNYYDRYYRRNEYQIKEFLDKSVNISIPEDVVKAKETVKKPPKGQDKNPKDKNISKKNPTKKLNAKDAENTTNDVGTYRKEEDIKKGLSLVEIYDERMEKILKNVEDNVRYVLTQVQTDDNQDKKSKKLKSQQSQASSTSDQSNKSKKSLPNIQKLNDSPRKTAVISYQEEMVRGYLIHEMSRCPDRIIFGPTSRANTLWSYQTSSRCRCFATRVFSGPVRQYCCVEHVRDKEELRASLENDLTEILNLSRDDADSDLIGEEKPLKSADTVNSDDETKKAKKGKKDKGHDDNADKISIRSTASRKSAKKLANKSPAKQEEKKAKLTAKAEKESEVKEVPEAKKPNVPKSDVLISLPPPLIDDAMEGGDVERYLLAAMRQFQIRKETLTICHDSQVQSHVYICFNKTFIVNYHKCF